MAHSTSTIQKRPLLSDLTGSRATLRLAPAILSRPPTAIQLLKQTSLERRYLGNVVFLQKQEALLISDRQRKCPRPMMQKKPVTQPADGGEGATPYCWSWRLDFLSLGPPRAHCTMCCGR